MKDWSKLKSNVYCGASVDAVNRNMINRQMFHHYRRVLSARKVVDSSPPLVYSRQGAAAGTPRSSRGGGCIVAEMLTLTSCGGSRRSALDVRSPVCATPQKKKKKSCGCRGTDRKSVTTLKCPPDVDVDVEGASSTAPRRRDAQSKVRGLRVYHPPRKRSKQRTLQPCVTSGESSARSTTTTPGAAWASADLTPAVCFCGVAKAKVLSSCDSAYNGGGTSSAAESAASSPARRQHDNAAAAAAAGPTREAAFRQFVDVACQTEDGDTGGGGAGGGQQPSLYVDRGTQQEQEAAARGAEIPPSGAGGWSLTELFLYPDPFDDDLLLEECLKDMQGLSLLSPDVPPSLSAELFV